MCNGGVSDNMSFLIYLRESLFYLSEEKKDWWFKYATLDDVIELVKKEVTPISIENFEKNYDDLIDINDILDKRGFFGEIRKWKIDRDRNIALFGNYTMKSWYNFLKDIAENGLREPILLTQDGSEIIEGNHRVQALRQLGYKKVPVIYEKK